LSLQFKIAKRRTSADKKYYCDKCWEECYQDNSERYTTAWKPVEGGFIKAKDTSIELFPDQYDEDPAVMEAYQAQLLLEQQAAEAEAAAIAGRVYRNNTNSTMG